MEAEEGSAADIGVVALRAGHPEDDVVALDAECPTHRIGPAIAVVLVML